MEVSKVEEEMEAREMIEKLVPQLTRNAMVLEIHEGDEQYSVTIAGTSGVTARCHLSRDEVDEALGGDAVRTRVAGILKRCADQTVVSVGDARG